jgi:predicted murein hydrolase (TIGR00659 family)
MISGCREMCAFLQASPLLWLAVTLLAYQIAYAIYLRSGRNPFVNPVFGSISIIITVLLATRTPYRTYFDGAGLVHFLIGPATVAMAVPLYTHTERLKRVLLPLAGSLFVGSGTAVVSAVAIGWLFGASTDTLLSLAPKSTTMPIAMGITEKIGGSPSLTSLMVTMTGISGAIMARGLLKLLRIDDLAIGGFAIGVSAHAIGTAYALQLGEVAGAFSALGMGLNGVATTILVPLLMRFVANR